MFNTRTSLVAGLVTVALAAACSRPSADTLLARGNDLLAKNQVSQALIQYRLAAQADPKRGDILLRLGEAYLRLHDGPKALKNAVFAADLMPKDFAAQMNAGGLLLLAGLFEDARGRADRALAINPKSVDALILAGNALAGLRDMDAAVTQYQEALALDPKGAQAYTNIGAIQYSRGQIDAAEATFRRAVAANPASMQARLALASFFWASKRFPDAESTLKDALGLDPDDLGPNRAFGAFYMATGRRELAEPFFKKVADATRTDDARIALADYYLALNRLAEARTILEPINERTDFSGPAPVRLAAIAVAEGDRPTGAKIIQRVLDKTPGYLPARVFRLRLLLADGKLDETLVEATTLAKEEGNSAAAAEANLIIGGIENSRDRTAQAIKAFEEALRIEPQNLAAALTLAQVQMRVGNSDRAETYALQVLTAQPRNPVARAVVVRARLIRHDTRQAEAELASLEREFPNAVPVLNLIAARDLAAGRKDRARMSYQRAAVTDPDNLEALEGLVIIDLAQGKKKSATDRVEAVVKRATPSAELYVIAARAHVAAGDTLRAEELLRQAIEREPARIAAYAMLARLYVEDKLLDAAEQQLAQLLKRDPRSVPINTMLGMLFETKRDLAAAEQQYLKTLAVDQNASVAANNLAWLYVSSNQNLDVALQLAQTAQRNLPEDPQVNDTLGWAYYRKGLYSQAVRHLQISAGREQKDPGIHYHLGMAYVRNKDPERGKKALQRALSLDPTFDGADEAKKTLASLEK
jgi:tetratricopeptide (TPR) repeat protein